MLQSLNNTGQVDGIKDADIDAPEAWSFTKGAQNIKIAVLDEGVYLTHPDLVGHWVTPDPSGVTCDGEDWWGSNFGTQLDVVAPGVKIYSTDCGTSSTGGGTVNVSSDGKRLSSLQITLNPATYEINVS